MSLMRSRFRSVVLTLALGGLVACTTSESLIPDRRPDYRQSKRMQTLEVPPDLTTSTIDDNLAVPDLNPTSSASLSDYARERTVSGQVAVSGPVLKDQPGMHMERDGERRWLIVQQEPGQLWPKIKEFWISNGIPLQKDDPRIGIMETEWVENRADIPDGAVRALLGKVLDFAYSAPTRDKFRVRLERVPEGTAVYLTHYGVMEIEQGGIGQKQSENTVWQPRPNDPELEAEMLNRLMVYLGASERRAETQLASTQSTQSERSPRAHLEKLDGQQTLVIDEDYSRAWRLVGLGLDSSNFVVEDQDRSRGLYVVEYHDSLNDGSEKGFLSRLAFWKDEPPPQGIQYRVRLAGQGSQTVVVIQNAGGQPDDSRNARLILDSLLKEIR